MYMARVVALPTVCKWATNDMYCNDERIVSLSIFVYNPAECGYRMCTYHNVFFT